MSTIQTAAVSYDPPKTHPQLTQIQYQQFMQQQQQQQPLRFQQPMAASSGSKIPPMAEVQLSIKGTVVITVLFAIVSNSQVQQTMSVLLSNYVTMLNDTGGLTVHGIAVTCAIFIVTLYGISKCMADWLV